MMEAFQVSLTNISSAFSVLTVSLSLGFNSYVSRYPFDGVGIAVLTNDNELGNAISIAIKYRLSDQALGLSPIDSKAMYVPRNATHLGFRF